MTIPAATIAKLGKLFPRLATNHDGEVIATVRAIVRTLESAGASLHDLGPGLETRTVEKIVYREKVVYRDKPVEKSPAPNSSAYELVADWRVIVRLSNVLLNQCTLNDTETGFVAQVCEKASRLKSKFGMTVKQRQWWDSLLRDYELEENGSE
jgi:hypothetical protein